MVSWPSLAFPTPISKCFLRPERALSRFDRLFNASPIVVIAFRDASEEDLKLWLPQPEKAAQDLDVEMALFLLTHVGDQFCWMVQTEKEAKAEALAAEAEDGDGPPPQQLDIAWKNVVQGVREMCDVCETTLFNFHWACGKCGYVVCIDCYKSRRAAKQPLNNGNGAGGKDDEKEVRVSFDLRRQVSFSCYCAVRTK